MKGERTGRPGRATAFWRYLVIPVLATLGVIGFGTAPAIHGQANAAEEPPNVVVIETDDQTVESMRVMANATR